MSAVNEGRELVPTLDACQYHRVAAPDEFGEFGGRVVAWSAGGYYGTETMPEDTWRRCDAVIDGVPHVWVDVLDGAS